MLTLHQRHRLPKQREIALTWRTLAAIVSMKTVEHGFRESIKGVPNYRIAGFTNGRQWFVDIYARGYYVVTVGDRFPEPCHSLPSVMGFLCRMLGVRPR